MKNLKAMHRRAKKMERRLKYGKLSKHDRRHLEREWEALKQEIVREHEIRGAVFDESK